MTKRHHPNLPSPARARNARTPAPSRSSAAAPTRRRGWPGPALARRVDTVRAREKALCAKSIEHLNLLPTPCSRHQREHGHAWHATSCNPGLCVCVCVCDEYQSDPSTPIHGPSTICHPDLTFKRKSSVLVDRGSCPSTAANVLRV